MRTHRGNFDNPQSAPEPIPFPGDAADIMDSAEGMNHDLDLTALPDSAERALAAIDSISRRIDDLARELKCLGYFDDDDKPPAA